MSFGGIVFTERIVVPGGEGRATRVAEGQIFAVVDLEGGQVGDLFLFAEDGSGGFHSASHTRMTTGRMFPLVGQAFASEHRRPLATVIEDDQRGGHDMLCAACDSQRYLALGALPGHRNCSDNLLEAVQGAGHQVTHVPQPVNVFMRVAVVGDQLELLPAVSKPGDRLVLRAETALVVVLSACPQDLSPVNNGVITDLALDL